MFGDFVTKMRNYGLLAQRFRKAYGAVVNQQYERALARIDALPVDEEEKERLRVWAAGVRQREYLDRVPGNAAEVGG